MKITVIFTGGTIACSNKNGALSPDGANSFTLIEMYRAVDGSVEFETLSPYFILSENLGCEHWEKLSDCIKSVSGSDGVIVTLGTDTLPYTAAYLGLKLGLCDIPVVLVSAARSCSTHILRRRASATSANVSRTELSYGCARTRE